MFQNIGVFSIIRKKQQQLFEEVSLTPSYLLLKSNHIENVLFAYNSISKKKKGRILNDNSQIIDLIKNDLNNNDYLMVKASNATGLNKIVREIKG